MLLHYESIIIKMAILYHSLGWDAEAQTPIVPHFLAKFDFNLPRFLEKLNFSKSHSYFTLVLAHFDLHIILASWQKVCT